MSFMFCSMVASLVVRLMGSKNALVLGTTGYWLFVAANLKPSWYSHIFLCLMTNCCVMNFFLVFQTLQHFFALVVWLLVIGSRFTMVPASLYLGFTASIIWVGQVQLHVLFPLMLILNHADK